MEPEELLFPLLVDDKELASAYRVRKKIFEEKSVHSLEIEDELSKGWELQRAGKHKSRVRKDKSHDRLLEDRLWCLFYRMGYGKLSGANFEIAFPRGRSLSTI